MALAARLITFPMPTVGAINGHAFGAGFMWALSHDQRVMRVDRGLMCANEIEIGIAMPALGVGRHFAFPISFPLGLAHAMVGWTRGTELP